MGNKILIRIHILLILMVLLAVGTALWNLDIETGDNTGKFNLCQNFDRKSNAYLICKFFKNGSLSPHEVEGMLKQCVEFPKWPRMREMPWSKHYSPQNNKAMRMSHRSLKHTEGCFAISKDPVKPIESITLEELILLARATTQAVAYSVILLLLYYLKHNSTGAMKHRKYKTDGRSSTRIKIRVIVSVEGLFLKGRKSVKFEHVFYDHDKVAIKGMKYGNNGKFGWLFRVFEYGWHNVSEYIVYSAFQRLASYRPLCDSELSVSPIQLANAGFRYLSEKSVYECEGCGNEVRMDGFTSQPTDPLYHKSSCQYMKSNSEELTSAQRAYEATDNIEEGISTSSADVTIQATEVRADTSNAESLHSEEVASNNDNEEVVYGATAAPPSSGHGRERQTCDSSDAGGDFPSFFPSGASFCEDDLDDFVDGEISEPEHSECRNPDKVKPIHGLACGKNPGHYAYFPAGMLDLQYIPSQCRFPEVLNFLKEACKLVVRVVVNENSTRRPKEDPSRSELPRVGTGSCFERVADIAADSNVSTVTKFFKKKKCGRIYVETNRHIVFDDTEAQKTTVEFFYDYPNRKGVIKFKGISLLKASPFPGDNRCILECKTNQDFVGRLNKIRSDVMTRFQNFPQPIKEALTERIFVIAHPHGAEKVLSYGDCVMVKYSLESKRRDGKTVCSFRKVTNQQQVITENTRKVLLYTADTCPGSTGAPVIAFRLRDATAAGGQQNVLEMDLWMHNGVDKLHGSGGSVFKELGEPARPDYVSFERRLKSFAEWDYGDVLDPRPLAEAGFFYSGYFVTCFQCGHGLSSLEEYCDHKHRPVSSYAVSPTQMRQHLRETNHERTYKDVVNHGNSARSQTTFLDNMGPNNGGEVPTYRVFTDLGQPSDPDHSRSRPRLDSFSEWSYGHIQDHFTLIEAGFFNGASSGIQPRPAVLSEVMTVRLDEGNTVMHEIPQHNIAYENE